MGILTGGIVAGIWPLINTKLSMDVPPLIPGFILSAIAIYLFSFVKEKPLRKKRIKT